MSSLGVRSPCMGIFPKAEFAEEGTFFSQTDFLPLEFFVNKKVGKLATFIISVLKVVY